MAKHAGLGVWWAGALCATLLPGVGAADRFSAHATASGTLGLTDNLFSAPNTASPGREADAYLQLRPGALLSYESWRMIHELIGEAEGTGYATHPDGWSASTYAGWRGYFVLSEFADVFASASHSQGRAYAVMPRSAATPPSLTPGGRMDFEQADASEHSQWVVGPRLSLVQFGFVRWSEYGSTAPSYAEAFEYGGELGLSYRWATDSIVVTGGLAYADLFRQVPDGIIEDNTYVHIKGSVSWRRDWTRRWNSALDVGATQIQRTSAPGRFFVPTLVAQASWDPSWGEATFAYRHATEPNLFLAENTIIDALSATARMPIPGFVQNLEEPTYTFEAGGVLSRTRILDARTTEAQSAINLIGLDAAANYTPRDTYSLSVRLMTRLQTGNEVGGTPGYVRNTLLFIGTWRWPERIAGQMPRRRTSRVESNELTPLERDLTGGRRN